MQTFRVIGLREARAYHRRCREIYLEGGDIAIAAELTRLETSLMYMTVPIVDRAVVYQQFKWLEYVIDWIDGRRNLSSLMYAWQDLAAVRNQENVRMPDQLQNFEGYRAEVVGDKPLPNVMELCESDDEDFPRGIHPDDDLRSWRVPADPFATGPLPAQPEAGPSSPRPPRRNSLDLTGSGDESDQNDQPRLDQDLDDDMEYVDFPDYGGGFEDNGIGGLGDTGDVYEDLGENGLGDDGTSRSSATPGPSRVASASAESSASGAQEQQAKSTTERVESVPAKKKRSKRKSPKPADPNTNTRPRPNFTHQRNATRKHANPLETDLGAPDFVLGTATSSRGKKRRTTTQARVRTRSSYRPGAAPPRPDNEHSEERLLERFNLPPTKRSNFDLIDFRLARLADPDHVVDLSHLARSGHGRGFVLIGRARPSAVGVRHREDEMDEDEDDQPGQDEQEWVTVHLQDAYERPKLVLKRDGLIVHARSASYRLLIPSPTYAQNGYADRSIRLLNVFAFARSENISGGMSGDPVRIQVMIENIDAAIKNARKKPKPLAFQQDIAQNWRVESLDDLFVEDNEKAFMFASLPDAPWVTPEVYVSVAPHFLPNTFRTDNVKRAEAEIKREKQREDQLELDYARYYVKDEDQVMPKYLVSVEEDSAIEHVEPPDVNDYEPELRPIKAFNQFTRGDKTVRTGDLLLLRRRKPAADKPCRGNAKKRRAAKNQLGKASSNEPEIDWEKDEDDGDEEEQKNDGTRGNKDIAASEFWLGEFRFAYLEEDSSDVDKDLQVHVSWFAMGPTIPSLGRYAPSRMVFQLDSCMSLHHSEVLAVVDKQDFSFVGPGESRPSRGWYCRAAYSEEDGSFKEARRSSSPHPASSSCSSCTSTHTYMMSTRLDENGERVLKPIDSPAKDSLFRLGGIDYHVNDFLYIALALEEKDYAPEQPLHLARLVGLSHEPDGLDMIQVEWLVRASRCKNPSQAADEFRSEREVLFTGKLQDIETTRIEGRFQLRHFNPTDLDGDERYTALRKLEDESLTHWMYRRIRADAVPKLDDELEEYAFRSEDCEFISREIVDAVSCTHCKATQSALDERQEEVHRACHRNSRFRLLAKALYAGGGLLSNGLSLGCLPLHVTEICEHHLPATAFFRSNYIHDGYEVDHGTVSDNVQGAYFRRQRGEDKSRVLWIDGGSPCQGFSVANRYRDAHDLRCLEPFVFLSSLSVHRPLAGLFENVAAFRTHALPAEGSQRGSFFQLFASTLLSLGYQARWNVDNAAAYGLPQDRRRLIVQFSAGLPLPDAPKITHACREPRKQYDHSLLEEGAKAFKRDPTADLAPHPFVTIDDALGDLPSFGYEECFSDGDVDNGEYERATIGKEWGSDCHAQYKTGPQTSYQLKLRWQYNPNLDGYVVSSLTHHVCPSVSKEAAQRLCKIGVAGKGKHGNYLDLENTPYRFDPPGWVLRIRNKAKHKFWMARARPNLRLTPLRTRPNHDGVSQGPRIHPTDSRMLSNREHLRFQGVPDGQEASFSSLFPDESSVETYRVVGNGVPLPLAQAYGRAFYESILPLLHAHISSPAFASSTIQQNVFESRWREVGAAERCEHASLAGVEAYEAEQARIAELGRQLNSDESDSDAEDSDEEDSPASANPSTSSTALTHTAPKRPVQSQRRRPRGPPDPATTSSARLGNQPLSKPSTGSSSSTPTAGAITSRARPSLLRGSTSKSSLGTTSSSSTTPASASTSPSPALAATRLKRQSTDPTTAEEEEESDDDSDVEVLQGLLAGRTGGDGKGKGKAADKGKCRAGGSRDPPPFAASTRFSQGQEGVGSVERGRKRVVEVLDLCLSSDEDE
ncbi:hypothetical protein JCM8097_001986 [Rhodosporidiobolus ruineniae]